MASEDVIELGSSDEETAEPAPKKRKPPPNAMVHIPGKLPLGSGMTITKAKSTKPRINPASMLKGTDLTVTKVSVNKSLKVNPLATVKKVNDKSTKGLVSSKSGVSVKRNLQIPIMKSPMLTNMLNTIKPNPFLKVTPKISPKSVPPQISMNTRNITVMRPQLVRGKPLNTPMSHNNSPLSNTKLPPGIIITRTSPSANKSLKSKINDKVTKLPLKVLSMSRSGSMHIKPAAATYGPSQVGTEVPTVELDDDETPPSSGPQWYLRPEEQDKDPLAENASDAESDKTPKIEKEKSVEKTQQSSSEKAQMEPESSTLEKQNNKEPEKSNFIEITIEDSPIKLIQNKKGFQVGAELSITIDDSPVRNKAGKAQNCNSDEEKADSPKEYNSKKQLQYSKTDQDVKVVEIEFEPIQAGKSAGEKENEEKHGLNLEEATTHENTTSIKKAVSSKNDTDIAKSASSEEMSASAFEKENPISAVQCIDIVEIEESPIKPVEEIKKTPKKNRPSKPAFRMEQPVEIIDLDEKEKDEFNSMYQSFIKLCLQLENSDDMKKIVEKKIKAYYRQVPKEYTDSDAFIDLVGSKIMAMKAAPEKMYLYIKDVVDELNLQRKIAKAQPAKEKNEEQEKFLYGKDSEFDAKRQRQIRKLEKTLKKLHRAIQKLEEQEVDFDDEEDSVYLLTERYKERSVRVHAKLCQLTNTKMPSEARVQIDPRPGQPKGPAKRLEKWINRKVPIGTPLPFPDFHDVLRCVREANKEDKIGWNEADIMEEARDLFVRCGKKLQRRRQENEWRLAASRVPADAADPVENSPELKRQLEENRRLAAKKEIEVFNKYADRQKQLKLEAVEIGDKEAEESPIESDDEIEEVVEVTDSATDKLKRKERIKRLLQKSKVSEDKQKSDRSPAEEDISNENPTKDCNTAESSKNNEKDSEKDLGSKEESPELDHSENNLSNKETEVIESDDNRPESDAEENSLLQRRFSVSNYSSSDTGSAIAIDTSSSNEKSSDEQESKKRSSDVISIENSSYSESEEKKDYVVESTEKETVEVNDDIERTDDITEEINKVTDESNKVRDGTMDINMELDCSVDELSKTGNKSIEQECNGIPEDVLLASSDEAEDEGTSKTDAFSNPCINLRDDNISIGETMIVENREIDGSSEDSKEGKSDKNTDSSSLEGMEIGPAELVSNECIFESIPEIECRSVDSETLETVITKSQADEKSNSEITSIECNKNTDDINANAEETKVPENVNEIEAHSIQQVGDIRDRNVDAQNAENNLKDTNENAESGNDNPKSTNGAPESMEKDKDVQNVEDISTQEIQDVINATKQLYKVSENISESTKENNNLKPCESMEIDTLETL